MNKQKNCGIRIIQGILGILLISAFLFFVIGELCLPAENIPKDSTCHIFLSDWVKVSADGTEKEVTVPGKVDAERGEWVTIKTELPEIDENTSICVRSMQQEMKIYVDDELRKEYSTLDTQLFGKTSTMTFVFIDLYGSDTGKTLRIDFKSASSYTGYVNEMFIGERADIVNHFYRMYAPSITVAALMLLVSLFVIICSAFVHVLYKRKVELLHLGNAILIASMWLIVESKLRQFVFPNSTVAMMMGFLLIAILPYPFMSYINSIQQNRYKKAYIPLGVAIIINYIVIIVLQVLNVKDFFETMTASHIIILLLIIVMGTTIIRDVIKGYVKQYREVAIAFAGLMLSGICEIVLTYIVSAQLNGIALCIGLVLLLFAAGLKSIRDLFNVEKEKQLAIETSKSKAKFLANMSHEIRTPINTVIGMNEMILRENENEAIGEYAINIKHASQMLLGLINDVLDFSKIEAGKLEITESKYYLADMLRDTVQWVEVRVKQKNLEFKLEIDERMPAVLNGDELRIKQILNNLLSNAIKYTENGSVTLSVEGIRDENGFSLKLSIADTGKGIKKDDIEKLFDSFQRLEETKNRYIEGTGLGLNITKQLVALMNGTIEVQSVYGSGSQFVVCIPQQIVDDTEMGSLENKSASHALRENREKKQLYFPDARILIVDDNKMNLKVMEMLLKRSLIRLDFASGGKECLEKTAEEKYDLILMDHMMPEPDGVQTLHIIRADNNNKNQNTPVIVLTANAIAGMKEQYIKEGFADYLSKPIEIEKMEEMIAKFLTKEYK